MRLVLFLLAGIVFFATLLAAAGTSGLLATCIGALICASCGVLAGIIVTSI